MLTKILIGTEDEQIFVSANKNILERNIYFLFLFFNTTNFNITQNVVIERVRNFMRNFISLFFCVKSKLIQLSLIKTDNSLLHIFGRISDHSRHGRSLFFESFESSFETKYNFLMSKLPKKYTKSNLPTKICAHCGREMEWRKSWAKNWEEVKYCSDRCRKEKKSKKIPEVEVPTIVDALKIIFASALTLLMGTYSPVCLASTTSKPLQSEIRALFPDAEWDNREESFRISDFKRMNQDDDKKYYEMVRLRWVYAVTSIELVDL